MNESGDAPEIRIKNEEQLQQWLDALPIELRAGVAVALVARMALRILPLAATHIPEGVDEASRYSYARLVAPVAFRATALARVAVNYPIRAYEPSHFNADCVQSLCALLNACAAAFAAADIHAIAPGDASVPAASRYLITAGYAAVGAGLAMGRAMCTFTDVRYASFSPSVAASYAADYAAADTAKRAAESDASIVKIAGGTASAADYAAWAAYADHIALWEALNADIDTLERGEKPESLAVRALWSVPMPAGFSETWQALRGALPSDDNWDIWLGWYENVLAGRSPGEAYEHVFASVPLTEWDKGPASANAWIKAHLPKEFV